MLLREDDIAVDEAIVTTSWDDGHPLDLKLAELLGRYHIPTTFCIPIDNVERECMSPDEMRQIGDSSTLEGIPIIM